MTPAAGSSRKVVSRKELLAWRGAAPAPVVFTNGVFDLLHIGHVTLLEHAASLGGSLVVAVNSDNSARGLEKGTGRPVVPAAERARLLAAIGCVDKVVIFDEPTPLTLIDALHPDILVKGGDYAEADVVGAASVVARGGRVVIVPLVPRQSSTSLLERLRAET